jgi:hypothetical protein
VKYHAAPRRLISVVPALALAFALALAACQATARPEPASAQVVASGAPPQPSTVPSDAASAPAVPDACARPSYPVPTDVELHDASRTQHGWFHPGDREHAIEAACDLPDRVVMIESGKPSVLWIWTRADGSATSYKIDWQNTRDGHTISTSREAPDGNQVFDAIDDGPSLRLMTSIGSAAPGIACRFAGGGEAIADPLIACSTRHGFAKIDALPPRACATYPDGVGWPLALTWWSSKGPRTLAGTLDSISSDRGTFTYRFGTGKDTIDLALRPGEHGGNLWFADGHHEACTMIYTDRRRG